MHVSLYLGLAVVSVVALSLIVAFFAMTRDDRELLPPEHELLDERGSNTQLCRNSDNQADNQERDDDDDYQSDDDDDYKRHADAYGYGCQFG